ncbi:MAG: DUF4162 domain-containing protein, partial [Chloroflexi bacterium]|nr:DUF4162 domain-containing protein [Chloroflexota bacterium]
ASSVQQLAGVSAVRQSAPRHFLVTTDDAGAATPRLLQHIQAAGTEVVSSSEYRPSFDEVFAELVSQADKADAAGEGDRSVSNSRGIPRAA